MKGATYENQINAIKYTITKGLQPLADKLMCKWTKELIDESTGEYLCASYEHLPEMKEDELKSEQAQKTMVERLSQLYKDNIINKEQYAMLAGIKLEEIKDAPQTASQGNLRGLVGSVTGIMQINQLVAQQFVDKSTAINIIMAVYGYDASTASGMITSLTVEPGTVAPSLSTPKE